MEKRLYYTISREAANIQREPFVVSSEIEFLHIHMEVPAKCHFMGYVLVEDPRGNVRLQKLLGYGNQDLAIGITGVETSVGGVPGVMEEGTWNLILGIFTEYVQQKLGDEREVIEAHITEQRAQISDCKDMITDRKEIITYRSEQITEPLGAWVWTKDGALQVDENKYDWNHKYSSNGGWFKGDFHTHTTLSDGKETRERAMEKAKLTGLEFYVPTEHNLLHTGWCDTDLCILPGTEITTDQGHFNLFGVTEIPERLMDIVTYNGNTSVEHYVKEIMQEARNKNWIVSLNHPFLTIWKWRFAKTRIDEFDCVEIVNDPTYTDAVESNEKAIRFLDALWQDGHRVFGVGGSDSHNLIEEYYEGANEPSIAGDPGTYVYCEQLSPAELMKHVRSGHIYVSRHCKIEPVISMGGKAFLPGDALDGDVNSKEVNNKSRTISSQANDAQINSTQINSTQINSTHALEYSIKITDLKEDPIVRLIQNGGAVCVPVTYREDGSFEASISVSVNLTEWTWIRMDIRRKNGEFLGFINPVYCGNRIPQFQTFGEIIEAMGEPSDD